MKLSRQGPLECLLRKLPPPWYWRIFFALVIFWFTFALIGGAFAGVLEIAEHPDYWLCGFMGFGVGWVGCWWLYTDCGAALKKRER